jgi:osmotically-inducible protein OsmY
MKRNLTGLVLLLAAAASLQACFPLAVTGVGAAALMASDRRTPGIYIEDETIEWKSMARMINNGKFSPTQVKVVTEAGVVYLMGLVTPAEADAAVEIARTTSGVSRVVKVFEYVK